MKLIEIMNQMDLTDIYREFHPSTKEYTFFSMSHGSFAKIDYIVSQSASLNIYKKIEIMPRIFHGLKLEFQ